MGSEITEFVNKVRNQVRFQQKRMSSIAENCTEHSIIWGMFMATTLNAATIMGNNFSTMRNVVKNQESLTLKQMFDILCVVSAKFFNILNATKLGRTELQEYEPRKATEMMLSVERRQNSSGIFSQDSQRCSSVTRSAIF